MVPAKGATQAPHFPLFVEWILQNQHNDGSWGLGHLDPCSLGKDAVSSTLACILALKTWNMGDEHIRKGMNIESTHVNTKLAICQCVTTGHTLDITYLYSSFFF
jgi:hypothetical protein